jgi:hypothetical protein
VSDISIENYKSMSSGLCRLSRAYPHMVRESTGSRRVFSTDSFAERGHINQQTNNLGSSVYQTPNRPLDNNDIVNESLSKKLTELLEQNHSLQTRLDALELDKQQKESFRNYEIKTEPAREQNVSQPVATVAPVNEKKSFFKRVEEHVSACDWKDIFIIMLFAMFLLLIIYLYCAPRNTVYIPYPYK